MFPKCIDLQRKEREEIALFFFFLLCSLYQREEFSTELNCWPLRRILLELADLCVELYLIDQIQFVEQPTYNKFGGKQFIF